MAVEVREFGCSCTTSACMYTVRVSRAQPVLATSCSSSSAGRRASWPPRCAISRQALAEDDPGRKDMLLDIATEELSHLEVIGTIVAMLNKGMKGKLAEGPRGGRALSPTITAGGDSHTQSLLYGGGAALTNSAGVPWTAAYVDTIGEPTATCAPTSPPKPRQDHLRAADQRHRRSRRARKRWAF